MLTLRDLKRPNAAMMSRVPDDLLLELARIDDGLPDVPTPVYADQAERDRIAGECHGSFLAWCVEALRHSGFAPAAHHRLLIDYLQRVVDGEIRRLMIFMPPGAAKSTFVSELLPSWFFAHVTGEPIILASHTRALALRFSGRVQRYAEAFGDILGYGLRTQAKERWEPDQGGEFLAAGVGGALPGYRAKLAIIDDPFKGREDADSENTREKVWAWWNGDLLPRLKPDASLILMHTRYHLDDIAGRLLATEPQKWTVLSIPAVAEDPADSRPDYPIEPDPLGRAPGEPLWADDAYGYGQLMLDMKADLERKGATREWQSQYQQHPRPAEGALFKTGKVETLEQAPELRNAVLARGWDLAATKKVGTKDPDWTVGILLARLSTGFYVVLDVFRDRGGPDQVDAWIKNTAAQDRAAYGSVKQSLPEDPGQAGKTQALAFARLLAGFSVETSRETGDKATRAAPVISQLNAGNVAIVRAGWNRPFLDEIAAFPSGVKDDQVDALSRAFSVVGLGRAPMKIDPAILAKAAPPRAPFSVPAPARPQRML